MRDVPRPDDPPASADDRPSRRRLLRVGAAAASLAVAGCVGSGSDPESTEGPTDADDRPTETRPPTATRTATTAGTATGTATDADPTTDPGTATDGGGQPAVSDPPATGEAVPELDPVEAAVRSYATDRDVPAAALGVARDGEVLLERGYGYRDAALTEPVRPDARFRIASVTKSLTKAAVESLVAAGDLSRDASAFETLGIEPLPGDDPDERVYDVTVEHLLNHRGGLGPLRPVNPMFDVDLTFEMAERMDLSGPPTTRQRARFMLGRPLQFEPGSRESYSNFGYAVLGLLVAELSGRPFPEFVRTEALGGVPAGRLYRGRTLPAQRRSTEVDYYSARRGPNVMALDRDDRVPLPDGGIHLEALGAAGGLVTTTRTLLGYLADRQLFGLPRSEGPVVAGSLPGTLAMGYQHPEGADVVVLTNRRRRGWRTDLGELKGAIDEGIAAVDRWP
jgi:N-acyl-D-amino-acid deacylase